MWQRDARETDRHDTCARAAHPSTAVLAVDFVGVVERRQVDRDALTLRLSEIFAAPRFTQPSADERTPLSAETDKQAHGYAEGVAGLLYIRHRWLIRLVRNIAGGKLTHRADGALLNRDRPHVAGGRRAMVLAATKRSSNDDSAHIGRHQRRLTTSMTGRGG
jgi:hypothetical protein